MAQSDYEVTQATARLPLVDIEILRRRPWEGGEEQMAVVIRAVPACEAFGRLLEASHPLLVWSQMMQLAWSPWLAGFSEETVSLLRPHMDH